MKIQCSDSVYSGKKHIEEIYEGTNTVPDNMIFY